MNNRNTTNPPRPKVHAKRRAGTMPACGNAADRRVRLSVGLGVMGARLAQAKLGLLQVRANRRAIGLAQVARGHGVGERVRRGIAIAMRKCAHEGLKARRVLLIEVLHCLALVCLLQ